MEVVTDRKEGLFPLPGEMSFHCSCPDWASMCKHVAAVLYGIGARLDSKPELLFTLRGVNHEELIEADAEKAVAAATSRGKSKRLAADEIGAVFGIEIDAEQEHSEASSSKTPSTKRPDKAVPKRARAKKVTDKTPGKQSATTSRTVKKPAAVKTVKTVKKPAAARKIAKRSFAKEETLTDVDPMLQYLQCRQCREFTTLWTDRESVLRACVWCGNRFHSPCGSYGVAGQTPPTLLSATDRLRNEVCRVCGLVLSFRQSIEKICGDPHCRTAYPAIQSREEARRASRQRRSAAVVRAKARRWFRTALQQSPAIRGLQWKTPDELDVLVLPANTRLLAGLPESRKQEFINEAESFVGAMRQDGTQEAETAQQESPGQFAEVSSEPNSWAHSCAVCGGYCCQSGGTHAYLRPGQIARYTQSHHADEPDDVVRAYASHLPVVSFENSCVYHGAQGCTLPFEMRSEACLSFYCVESRRVHAWFQANSGVPVLLAAVADGKIHRLALFDGADCTSSLDRHGPTRSRSPASGASPNKPSRRRIAQTALGDSVPVSAQC